MNNNAKETADYLIENIKTQVPLIAFCNPNIKKLSSQACSVLIPLTLNTRSHIGSMGFGALAIGADCTGGFLVWYLAKKLNEKIDFCFSNAKINFLKKPKTDVLFNCLEGEIISEAIKKTLMNKQSVNILIHVTAETITPNGTEPVATFEMNLAIKAPFI